MSKATKQVTAQLRPAPDEPNSNLDPKLSFQQYRANVRDWAREVQLKISQLEAAIQELQQQVFS